MRRILLAIGLSCAPLCAFEGLYVGAAIGGGLTEATQAGEATGRLTISSISELYPIDSQPNLFDHGVVGSLYAGYGLNWQDIYLSAEGFVQWHSASLDALQTNENSYQTGEGETLFSATDAHIHTVQAGIDLLPGWSPNLATLLYGRIGCGFSRISLDTTDTNTAPFAGVGPISLSLSHHREGANLRVGGGVECRLTPHFSLRTDYVYNDYGKLSIEGSLVDPSGLAITRQGTIHLYDHLALLALSYRFSACESLEDLDCSTADYCGLYLGGGCGGSALEGGLGGSASGSDLAAGLTGTLVEVLPQRFHNQFQGVAYLGIGFPLERLYLGGELFLAAATDISLNFKQQSLLQATGHFWSTQSSASLSTSTCQYGLDIRPGLFLTPLTLFYSRIGCAAAEIKASPAAQFNGTLSGTIDTWALSTSDHLARWKAAFRFGIGLEQLLTPYLHLRADYVFTDYGRVSLSDFVSGLDSRGLLVTLESSFSAHLQNNALLVSLSYYFH